ncbi:hypothetical protein L873DRAFT_1801763 [Choiromyces venosus 120613-1]|uniref:Uncharacterized protein n=1 Tax=Choiromyces venosus 120613-1 TaxID=1336337 RepID=A0A3N4JWM3_9PEZI|nr:hypothetical protein L873DRAFT_1801763 [Choiromyces venosus 120613-1]
MACSSSGNNNGTVSNGTTGSGQVKRTVGQTHGHPVRAISYPLIPTLPQRAITLAPPEAAHSTWSHSGLSFKGLAFRGGIHAPPPFRTWVITTKQRSRTREPPHSIAREKFASNTSGSAELLFLANKSPRRPS